MGLGIGLQPTARVVQTTVYLLSAMPADPLSTP